VRCGEGFPPPLKTVGCIIETTPDTDSEEPVSSSK